MNRVDIPLWIPVVLFAIVVAAIVGARLWRQLLVVAAVGQAVSAALVSVFGGAFTTADRAGEPLIVPPGATFIIWNVIIAPSIGYAIWARIPPSG
jgi:hypothetical protein